jgi:HD-GYP domain-containing protein (c-di-GMP phosphodiesterase class II)
MMRRYLPHAVLATTFVMIFPATVVWAIAPAGNTVLLILSVPLAMGLSVAAASIGSSIWMRRPGSQDLVFADLMLWGYLRRLRAERRLADARRVLALGSTHRAADGGHPDRSVDALKRLSGLLEARDAYTHRHSRRVTRHAERIARALHLPPAEVAKVRTAAAVHDVGKIHVPPEILDKPGRLSDQEFAVIKRHPDDGADMLAGIGDAEIAAMVRHHHERVDGGGYPHGLVGDAIPLGSRIIAVADTFDAITTSRPYRTAGLHKQALDILSREAGVQLDAAAVHAFLSYYSGRRSVAWTTLVATAPQRFVVWLESTSATLVQAVPTVGAAALLATVPAGPAVSPATADSDRGGSRSAEGSRPGDSVRAAVLVAERSAPAPRRASAGDRPSRRATVRARPKAADRVRRPRTTAPVGARGRKVEPRSGSAPTRGANPRAPRNNPSHGGPARPGNGQGSGGGHTPPVPPTPPVHVPSPGEAVPPKVAAPDVDVSVNLPVELPVQLPVELPAELEVDLHVELPEIDLPQLDVLRLP